MNSSLKLLISFLLLLLGSCIVDNKFDLYSRNYLDIENIYITEVGKCKEVFEFRLSSLEDETRSCTIRTREIEQNDTILSAEAFIEDQNIYINIVSSPNFNGKNNETYYTGHDVNFNISGIENGVYNLKVKINTLSVEERGYEIL